MSPSAKGKRGLLLAISGKGEEAAPESEPAEAEEDKGSQEDEAIDSFLDAVQEQDREGARAAFRLAVEACMGSGDYGKG